MRRTNEVSYKDLKYTCNENLFDFDTTEELVNNYKGKQIVWEEFFVRTCGWKKFVEKIIKNVNKKVLTKLVNKNKYS